MTEIAREATAAHESYSFACMHCGHGWEQSYVIEHHLDAEGHEFVTYLTDGRRVPSPLSRPQCDHCDSRVLRIMRAGQVALALNADRPQRATTAGARQRRHLSDLLHVFHRRAG
jgi:DNA-directed RNA polymerase subunit RPC12/RpoP